MSNKFQPNPSERSEAWKCFWKLRTGLSDKGGGGDASDHNIARCLKKKTMNGLK